MISKRSIAALAVLATAAAAGTAVAAPAGGRTTTVTLRNIAFNRATVRIHKGDSVTWVWKDPTVPHNVTFAHRHSTTKQKGTYTLRFTTAGTFRYHCTIHPGMDGRVIVR
jgi:plastocyanin